MGHRVLLSAPYLIPQFERFRTLFELAGIEVVVAEVRERLSEQDLLLHAGHVDGVICGDDRFTARVLEQAAPRLRIISKWGTGVDSIDLDSANRLSIQVRNTPDAFTGAVADSVMGFLLAFARGLLWMDRSVKAGEWRKYPARAVSECTLGVIGVGRIGKAVMTRAAAFETRLLGNDIVEVDESFLNRVGAQMVPLEKLLKDSDFVSLNCDLNPTSHHLINVDSLANMRRSAVLINTARGAVVEEQALVQALQSGRLGGAALDVFEEEPLPEDSPLRQMDNVLLAPHNANASRAAWEKVHWNTIGNLFEGLGLPRPEPLAVDSEIGRVD